VARLLATGAPPADVFAAAVAGASAVLGVPTTLRRYAGDGATVVVASSGRSVPGPAPGAVPQAPGGVVAVPVEIATGVWGELGAVLSAACPQDEDGATRRLEPFAQLVAAAVHADDERARLTASAAQEAASQ
jgi:hypothetical protein